MFPDAMVKNRLFKMLDEGVFSIEIETENTLNLIQRTKRFGDGWSLGSFQWNLIIKKDAHDQFDHDREVFQRHYYLEESLVNEILEWINRREEKIIRVFSPNFSDQIS